MQYIGSELHTFAHATNWKLYVRDKLRPFVSGAVLEVGAGIGSFTVALFGLSHLRWSCVEPDSHLADQIRQRQVRGEISRSVEVINDTLRDLASDRFFDTILYLDVLEHIPDDLIELTCAASHLSGGGRLIVLSPAFPMLYSDFDAAIGHYRRYTRRTLEGIRPNELKSEAVFYLDSAGAFLSLANRLLLRSAMPNVKQVTFWDRNIIPCTRILDPIFGFRFGRSVVAVWQCTASR
jgi:protein-L-isoaspartate O-methyltransferase